MNDRNHRKLALRIEEQQKQRPVKSPLIPISNIVYDTAGNTIKVPSVPHGLYTRAPKAIYVEKMSTYIRPSDAPYSGKYF